MRSRRALGALALVITGALVLAACGDDDDTTAGTTAGRTITVTMTDNAFDPASITVAAGETVTFRFDNRGEAVHEAVIGDEAFQTAHATTMDDTAMMGSTAAEGGMDHAGADGDAGAGTEAVVVQPGDTGELTATFDAPGTLLIGCHQPGHYESGMKATLAVT
jgi:uncharacterized cupredoxin-like copper-binding protein